MRKQTHLLGIALLLAALLLPCAAFAADPVFSGNLRTVTPISISIRLASGMVIEARLPKTGNLASGPISTQYGLGDQVEITCKRIDAFHDPQADHYYFLELKKLRSLQPPSPGELANVVTSLSWHRGDNLLKSPDAPALKPGPSLSDGESTGLQRVREVNLEKAANMVNFTADEKATRSQGHTGSPKRQVKDTIESEITFHGSDATRQRVRINGKPWNSKSAWLPGLNWGIGFGDAVKPLLDRNCANTINFEGRAEARGKQLLVYVFHSPAEGCFGEGQVGPALFNPARTGRILVDDPGANVIQFEMKHSGVPPGFGFAEVKAVMSWDYVKIGDASHLLPVAADYVFTYPDGNEWHIEVQYKNHRHFETSIKLRFDKD